MAEHLFVLSSEAPALLEVMRLGALVGDPARTVELLCEQAARLTGADYAGLRLVDDRNQVEWRGMWGNRTDAWRQPRMASHQGPATEAMTTGRTIVSGGHEFLARRRQMYEHSVRANEGGLVELATPLAYGGRPLGALVLGWRSEVTVTDDQLRIAEALAGYGALILENARSRQETERRRAEAEALAELARQGAADQQMKAVVDLVCRSACQLVGSDFAALMIRQPEGGVAWVGVSGNRSSVWHEQHSPSGRGPAARSMAEGRTVTFRKGDAGSDGRLEGLTVMGSEDTETALAMPLLRPDGAFGSLVLGWRRSQEVSGEQRRLAEALSGYAAAVLDNALSHAALRERADAVKLANEQLTLLDEMKSNLISNVSHELRTPLTSIRAFSELLLDSNMDSSTRLEFAHIINAESERLTRLVSNLLDLSRIQSHGVIWNFQALDIGKQLELVVSALKPWAEEKQLALRIEVGPAVPTVIADADGLQQALLNLISNAIKFTAAGEVTVAARRVPSSEFRVPSSAEEGSALSTQHSALGSVEVSVSDTGPGITPEEQAHIFDRFYQAGNILTSKPAGTGLGLAITKEILVQHGTDVRVTSSPKGSQFSFFLPAAASAIVV